MNEDLSDIQKLIRLKRYEQPPADFMDSFMEEFIRRQRVEQMKRPFWMTTWEDMREFYQSWQAPQWSVAAACVLLVLGFAVSQLLTDGRTTNEINPNTQFVKLSQQHWAVSPPIYTDSRTGEARQAKELSAYLLGNHFSGGFHSDVSDLSPKQVVEEVPEKAPLEIEPIIRFTD
jgi:hypothetical protein